MKNELPPVQANSTNSTKDEDLSLDDEESVEKNETESISEPEPTSTFVPPTKTLAKVEEKKKEEE